VELGFLTMEPEPGTGPQVVKKSMSVEPIHKSIDLPWSQTKAERRNRRVKLLREHDCLLGAVEVEVATRQGRPLSSIERALVQTFCATHMAIAVLNHKLALGQVVDTQSYARMIGSMVKIAARLGVDRPTSRANAAKPDAVGVVSLSDYLQSKAGITADDAEAGDDD
jgi:hypothetical protein